MRITNEWLRKRIKAEPDDVEVECGRPITEQEARILNKALASTDTKPITNRP